MHSVISVIVPCYNQGLYLKAALNSVSAQSYPYWECIIVNDGSDDDTALVALEFSKNDPRFKYISQENMGLSAARNTGLKAASGSFIQLLDADDLIEPDKMQDIIQQYDANDLPEKTIVYSSMRYFETIAPDELKILGRNNFIAHIELKADDSLNNQEAVVKFRNPIVISAAIYPASLFKAIGLFDEQLTALEDWDFHLRCIAEGYKFHHHYTLNSKTLIRLHDSSMMRNQYLMDINFNRVNIKHHLSQNDQKLAVANTTGLMHFIRNAFKRLLNSR